MIEQAEMRMSLEGADIENCMSTPDTNRDLHLDSDDEDHHSFHYRS